MTHLGNEKSVVLSRCHKFNNMTKSDFFCHNNKVLHAPRGRLKKNLVGMMQPKYGVVHYLYLELLKFFRGKI